MSVAAGAGEMWQVVGRKSPRGARWAGELRQHWRLPSDHLPVGCALLGPAGLAGLRVYSRGRFYITEVIFKMLDPSMINLCRLSMQKTQQTGGA
jgi:hypothetical protein